MDGWIANNLVEEVEIHGYGGHPLYQQFNTGQYTAEINWNETLITQKVEVGLNY